MDKETFEFRFGDELVYTTPLSDGQLVELVPGGGNVSVRYDDRKEFIRLVEKARLEESRQQARLLACLLRPSADDAQGLTLCLCPCAADRSHAGRAAEGGSSGRSGPSHVAGSGKESVWRPGDHRGSPETPQ